MSFWNNNKTPVGRLSSDYANNHSGDSPKTLDDERYRMQMIGMRLRLQEIPFDSIHTAMGKEKVFVFVVQNDKPVVFEDDVHLYPSDTLITQLRLIAK